jgi:hypothetical protein
MKPLDFCLNDGCYQKPRIGLPSKSSGYDKSFCSDKCLDAAFKAWKRRDKKSVTRKNNRILSSIPLTSRQADSKERQFWLLTVVPRFIEKGFRIPQKYGHREHEMTIFREPYGVEKRVYQELDLVIGPHGIKKKESS